MKATNIPDDGASKTTPRPASSVKNLDIKTLLPVEHNTFTLADGKKLDFKNKGELGKTDMAMLMYLQNTMADTAGRVELNMYDDIKDDDGNALKTAEEQLNEDIEVLDEAATKLAAMILPDLENPGGYPLAARMEIVRFWQENTSFASQKDGEDRKNQRGRQRRR